MVHHIKTTIQWAVCLFVSQNCGIFIFKSNPQEFIGQISRTFTISPLHFQDSTNSEVELKVSLPDRNICVVTIRRNDNTNKVYNVSITSVFR